MMMRKYKNLILASVLFLLLSYFNYSKNPKNRVIFCNVGQGDGILVLEGNRQMIIDTGPNNKRMAECISRYLPFWDKEIEAVILTHEDSDHSGGIDSINKSYIVKKIWKNTDLLYKDIVNLGNINLEVLYSGQNGNNDSLVSVLYFNDKKYLLMGDVDSSIENMIEVPKVDYLKIGHHGSGSSTSEELLTKTMPKEAIISVGNNNKYGHPSQLVLDRLSNNNIRTRRTDIEGDIIFY